MNAVSTQPVAFTAAELWAELCNKAGLTPSTHDSELANDIARALGMDVCQYVKCPTGTAQQLFDAVLTALRPYSGMLVDLLNLYSWAGATTGRGDNLRLSYNFDSPGDPVELDLRDFRETVETWRRVTRPAVRIAATVGQLWRVHDALRAHPIHFDTVSQPRWELRVEADEKWPDSLPPLPATLDGPGVSVLERVQRLAEAVLLVSRREARSRSELMHISGDSVSFSGDQRDDLSLGELAQLHSDFWLSAIVECVEEATSAPQKLTDDWIARLTHELDAITIVEDDVAARLAELLEVLSLPLWGQRHGMYSAWLLTLMVAALGRDRVQLHVDDGRLSFSFSGTHLGCVQTALGQMEIWAELRSPYANPVGKGRRAAVQPDYTVRRPPVTSEQQVHLVIEAKQYARGKKRNFREVLADYCGAFPKAIVVLANYGTMPPSVLTDKPSRGVPIGHVRPNSLESIKKIKDAIRAGLPAPPKLQPALESPPPRDTIVANVMLNWTNGDDLDLDLHLITDDAEVYYTSAGTRLPGSSAMLWNDATAGPGMEIAHVFAGTSAISVIVRKYGGSISLHDAGATVTVMSRSGRMEQFACPHQIPGDEWPVCIIDPDGEVM